MSILASKLGQNHNEIANKLDLSNEEARRLGASEGPQRLELICEQYTRLSPNTAYLWIDPFAFQREIEEAQLHSFRVEFGHFLRNFLSLAPLIATWAALFIAVNSYQKDLAINGSDRIKPFLVLWQSGFHGLTWLTFTFAAGLDVLLLSLYLLTILYVHAMERNAHIRAVNFISDMKSDIDELLKLIADEGIFHVEDQADIDKVVDAVKKVIDSATNFVTKTVDSTTDAVKLYVDKAADTTMLAIDNIEQSLKTYIADAETAVKLVVDLSTQSITTSNNKTEALYTQQVIPMITNFHQDMGTLHTELENYQGRLNDLTSASQKLANASQGLSQASQTLTDNADRYMAIGQDIGTQIASLNRTQREVLSQIQTVAGGISTAAGNMTTATTNMVNTTRTVEGVAKQLDSGMRKTIDTMTNNVDQATQALTDVGNQLDQTTQALADTGTRLNQTTQALADVGTRLDQTADHLYNAVALLESRKRKKRTFRFPWPFRRSSDDQGEPTV